jgi:hypothetical protein
MPGPQVVREALTAILPGKGRGRNLPAAARRLRPIGGISSPRRRRHSEAGFAGWRLVPDAAPC